MKSLLKTSLLLAGATMTSAAFALTPAGTEIVNQAVATYDIPGGSSGVTASSEAKFNVLELIDVNVTSNNSGNQTVDAGDTDQVLTYTVTNNGNGSEVFTVNATNEATGDQFDVENIQIFVDTNGDGIFNAGDTEITSSPELTLAAETSTTIFVVNDIPAAATQDQQAKVKVEVSSNTSGASTAAPGTLLPTGEVVGNNPFNDKTDTFQVGVPTTPVSVDIDKTVILVEDPFHPGNPSAPGGVNQYVPGSKITYQIEVTINGSTGSVNNLVITDDVPNEMEYVSGSLSLGENGGAQVGLTDADDASTGGDNGNHSNGTITVDLGSVNVGSTRTIQLQAEIK